MNLLKNPMTRRDFLKFCLRSAAIYGGGAMMSADFAEAFMKIAHKEVPVIWLSGQGCTGDSMSLIYCDSPSLVPFLSTFVDLKFHPTLSVAQGGLATEIIETQRKKGGFVLCFEGAIPAGMPEACTIGDRPLTDVLPGMIEAAAAVIACGSCASYGGIPAANPETGAVSLARFMEIKGLKKPLVRLPGCPLNGHRLTGAVAYFVAYGKLPPLDDEGRPKLYYGQVNHDNCQRFRYFAENRYVMDYSRDKRNCLFKMGCRGPVTFADCPLRRWNRETSWCVAANTPCIGCAHPKWPWPKATGIYTDPSKIEDAVKFSDI